MGRQVVGRKKGPNPPHPETHPQQQARVAPRGPQPPAQRRRRQPVLPAQRRARVEAEFQPSQQLVVLQYGVPPRPARAEERHGLADRGAQVEGHG